MKYKPTGLILLLTAALCLISTGISGCNTVKGAGQDMQSAGQSIEDTAEKNKNY